MVLAVSNCSVPNSECLPANPDVVCDANHSCNPSTRKCEFKCIDDKGCNNGGSICMGGWCQPMVSCKRNADCVSGLCDLYGYLSESSDRCVPEYTRLNLIRMRDGTIMRSNRSENPAKSGNDIVVNILYVDNQNCTNNPEGTSKNPYCEIYQAVHRNIMDHFPHPIKVRSSRSAYSGNFWLKDAPSPLWIVGSDDGNDTDSNSQVAVSTPIEFTDPQSVDIALDGLQVNNDFQDRNALSCTTGSPYSILRLRRSVIRPSYLSSIPSKAAAISTNGCSLEIDRSAVIQNPGNGIVIENENQENRVYQITNSVLALNSLAVNNRQLLKLSGRGDFRFNTVLLNGKAGDNKEGVGIDCTRSDQYLTDSIVTDNWPRLQGTQFDNFCKFDRVYVGADAVISANVFKSPAPVLSNPGGARPKDFALVTKGKEYLRTKEELLNEPLTDPRLSKKYLDWDYVGVNRDPASFTIGAFQ